MFQSLEKGLKYASSYKETYTYVKKKEKEEEAVIASNKLVNRQ